MNQIKVEVNRETCCVYHMLSVAGCGYDNDYGGRFRNCHSLSDLAVLKRYEPLISVSGGEYCGQLYWLLVSLPARGEHTVEEFYNDLLALFRDGARSTGISPDAEQWTGRYLPYRDAITEISEVMVRNAPVYTERVWPFVREGLERYAAEVQALFDGSDFTDRAQRLVGQDLGADCFHAVLTDSVAFGPEAIDISGYQDVFGTDRPPEDMVHFIGHEFIICLLKMALKDTAAFQGPASWNLTEGLAEFYTETLLGESRMFHAQRKYMDNYRAYLACHPAAGARELFQAAEKQS